MAYLEKGWSVSCVFCNAPSAQADEKHLILYRGHLVFTLLNLFPYNPGHVMIAPYRHLDDLKKLSTDEQHELIQETARTTSLLRQTMHPDGFNIGINQGRAAGAAIEDHLHVHIVPRWNGDTSFMPIMAGTKVIPEELAATYRKLAPAFREAV